MQGSIGYTAWTNQTIFEFRDVPYAESPSGWQRFKAPAPIQPWTGIRNARNYGIQCPSWENLEEIMRNEHDNIDVEDCLNMAIYSTSVRTNPLHRSYYNRKKVVTVITLLCFFSL